MQAQLSNTFCVASVKQLLIDEIYAPKPSKEAVRVLAIKADQPTQTIADVETNTEPHAKLQKSELLRSLEAYGDCV